MTRVIDKIEQQLNELPTPQVDNLRKATQDQLAEEFITLRMFVAARYQQDKDVARDYALLHERLSDLQSQVIGLASQVRAFIMGDEPHGE